MSVSAADLASLPTDEKISIIMDRAVSGNLGEYIPLGDNAYRITADGKTFIVHRQSSFWAVAFKGAAASASDVARATRIVLARGSEGDV
jgi:hypothetical protein